MTSINSIQITDGNLQIAKIVRNGKWPENLFFHTDEKEFLQVATWNYNKGKHLAAHLHKKCKRTTNRINELLFIRKGKLRAYFYSLKGKLLNFYDLRRNDIVIIYSGGHAYDIMAKGTQVLEVKNGPFMGLKKEKKLL